MIKQPVLSSAKALDRSMGTLSTTYDALCRRLGIACHKAMGQLVINHVLPQGAADKAGIPVGAVLISDPLPPLHTRTHGAVSRVFPPIEWGKAIVLAADHRWDVTLFQSESRFHHHANRRLSTVIAVSDDASVTHRLGYHQQSPQLNPRLDPAMLFFSGGLILPAHSAWGYRKVGSMACYEVVTRYGGPAGQAWGRHIQAYQAWDECPESQYTIRVKDAVARLSIRDRLVLPGGSHHHAVALIITHHDHYLTLTIVNTGDGLNHHPRWPQGGRFQTERTYAVTPDALMRYLEQWHQAHPHQGVFRSFTSMALLYQSVESIQGITPWYPHAVATFHAPQKGGNCTYECLMNAFRWVYGAAAYQQVKAHCFEDQLDALHGISDDAFHHHITQTTTASLYQLNPWLSTKVPCQPGQSTRLTVLKRTQLQWGHATTKKGVRTLPSHQVVDPHRPPPDKAGPRHRWATAMSHHPAHPFRWPFPR